MTLCQACETIDIRDLLESSHGSEFLSIEIQNLETSPHYQPHHASLTALQDAAEAGCELCEVIWAYHHSQWSSHGTNECMCKRYLGPVRFTIYKSRWGSCDRLVVLVMLGNSESVGRRPDGLWAAQMEICIVKGAELPEEDSRFLARLGRGERPSNLRSELSLSMGTDWLDRCSREHDKCKEHSEEQQRLPTRVIDVGNALTNPSLHISQDGEVGQWVALSYCWGGNSQFTLNTKSYDTLLSGVPLLDFPSTLQDAVLVTRALGVRFLWIDALCIFQDDIKDWTIEAPKMSEIYSHAAVTIAATSAKSVDDGFLDRREPHFNCAFPWRRGQERDKSAYSPGLRPVFFRSPVDFSDTRKQSSSHWATRGWTFQEELLSKRLLCYTTGRMIWHCSVGMSVEPAEEAYRDYTLFSTLKGLPPRVEALEDGTEAEATLYTSWRAMVEGYTKRRLTFNKDRLPAFGAVAKTFSALLKDQYCAGWWKQDLLFGLLWGAGLQSQGSGLPGSSFLRARLRLMGHSNTHTDCPETPTGGVLWGDSSEAHAPSWSWASANPTAGLSWPQRAESFTYLAKISSVRVHGQPHDEFGCVEGGELTLDAPYKQLHLRLGSYSGALLNPVSLTQRTLTRLSPLANTKKLAQVALTRPDVLESTLTSRSVSVSTSSTEFTLIQLAKTTRGSLPVLYLMILQPQPTPGAELPEERHCRRVGLLELHPWQYDDDNTVGEEMTNRLEGAAYGEVIRHEWPTRTFVIV